jgi:chemotaxis signal transduction protein
MEWFEFEIENKPFHIETRFIFQVIHEANITSVPFVPNFYLGLTFYRGELFDVIHMASLLKNKKGPISNTKRTLVLIKWSDKKMALAPDRVVGLVHVNVKAEDTKVLIRKKEELNILTPEIINEKLLKEHYGPIQIRKDI